MESITELENLLVPAEELPLLAGREGGVRIVVLKQFRFHKALCIELYDAATTKGGKIKNPVTPVSASDAALFTSDPGALLFYASISRFQYPPAATKSGADIRALKTIIKNPLGLRFFYHNPSFSENVSAGSLVEVQVGAVLSRVVLQVTQEAPFYHITPQVTVGEQVLHPRQVALLYDYFVLHEGRLHLAANLTIIKLLHYFASRATLQVHQLQFKVFSERVLDRLEEKVEVVHSYIEAAAR